MYKTELNLSTFHIFICGKVHAFCLSWIKHQGMTTRITHHK